MSPPVLFFWFKTVQNGSKYIPEIFLRYYNLITYQNWVLKRYTVNAILKLSNKL